MEIFHDLGTRVAKAWKRARYETCALPDIAARELERKPLHQAVSYPAIIEWLSSTDDIPFQPNIDTKFGEPPLTLFWHPSFYIEALFWHSSTTSVHGHGFSGAFQVLAGTSVQTLFTFQADTPNGKCRIGRLRQREVALLRPGATQMIGSGEQFIHSVFHLGYPSVTIVIRTKGDGVSQYNYHRPGVAVLNDVRFDQLTTRLLQTATLQATLKSDGLRTTLRRIGQECDLATSFILLQSIQPILLKQRRLDVIADAILILGASHGHIEISKLAEALNFERQLAVLRRARETIVEDDLRLLLALLLTQQERSFVLTQVADYTQLDNPSPKIAEWIIGLAAKGVLRVPSDATTKRIVQLWLEHGCDTGRLSEGAQLPADVIARGIRQIESEPLLGPLFKAEPRPMGLIGS